MGEVVLTVFLSVVFLHAVYRIIETNWPQSYYTVGRVIDEQISGNPLRYVLFRFGPVYVTCVFAGAVLNGAGQPVVVPVLLIAVLHAMLGSGRILLHTARRRGLRTHPLTVTVHVTIMLGVLLVGGLAAVTASAFEDLVPSGQGLAVSLWTALLAGVTGAYLMRLTAARHTDEHDVFRQSRSDIPQPLWEAAEDAAVEVGAEARLVHAFMLVENIQRPAWTRVLERIAGRFAGTGTYGPLQVAAKGPMADVDALRRAIENRFGGRRVRGTTTYGASMQDLQWLRLFALTYNRDDVYAESVVNAYMWLEYPQSDALATTEQVSTDGLPAIEVVSFDADATGTVVAGTSTSNVHLSEVDAHGNVIATRVAEIAPDRGQRGEWSEGLTLNEATVTIEVASWPPEGHEPDETQRIRLPVPVRTLAG